MRGHKYACPVGDLPLPGMHERGRPATRWCPRTHARGRLRCASLKRGTLASSEMLLNVLLAPQGFPRGVLTHAVCTNKTHEGRKRGR
eukprot:848480-Alexandrium_andersonii.AAC.1